MKIPVSCNKDCGAGCPLTATVENGRVTKITDNELKGPWMSGCGRGYRSHRVLYRDDRLKAPLIRVPGSGDFREASWDEALDYTAEKLAAIKNRYGASSILQSGGTGACRGALHNSHWLNFRFLTLLGGCTTSRDSYSSSATDFAAPYVYGTKDSGLDAETLMDSQFIFMPGANIADTRFGCELYNRLKALRKKGVRMIVLDPRRTRTVTGLDAEWIGINPGTDAAFAAAVIYELMASGDLDAQFINSRTHGFEPFRDWLLEAPEKNAEWAAEHCGCKASDIKTVAACYREYKPAALLPGLSIQRNLGGENAARMMAVLQAVTGNVGLRGGSSGINAWGRLPKPRCGRLKLSSASAGADIRYEPVCTWPDMILDAGRKPPIKAAYNCGGNYLVQGADTAKSVRAWVSLDFSVTHELFMTSTARKSDVVFPVADYLERNDIVFAEGNFLLYSRKAVEPPPGVKSDFDIFCLLADRLGFGREYSEGRTEEEWLTHFLEESEVDDPEAFKESGIWISGEEGRMAFTDFVAEPGKPPLNTPSGLIEITSERYAETGGDPFPVYKPVSKTAGFRMVTPHSESRINGQFISTEKPEKAALVMNTEDAGNLGVKPGQLCRISSETGVIERPAVLSNDIIRGTVCISCSYSNMLTSTQPTLPSKGARTHSTFVDIEPL